jgi:hypothetical protein
MELFSFGLVDITGTGGANLMGITSLLMCVVYIIFNKSKRIYLVTFVGNMAVGLIHIFAKEYSNCLHF